MNPGLQRSQIRIRQMDCPTEATLISEALAGQAGVHALEFNLIQRVLTVQHSPQALPEILQSIRRLGFTPETHQPGVPEHDAPNKPWWPLLASGVAAIAAEAGHWLQAPWYFTALMALLAVLGCGLGTYRKGLTALRNRQLNINALMSIAITGAFLIGQWPEAAMVMVLFTLAERIEAMSLERARRAVMGLMKLAPEQANVQQSDGSWRATHAHAVPVGALVKARPGERIALDGIVTKGRSSLDQAAITGESIPVDKAPGDQVFAGTINGSGGLEYRTTSSAADSSLTRIINAIEQAQSVRAPTQRFVDEFARYYTPIVVLLAFIVAIAPPLAGLGSWYDWLYKALVLLVIACPCALVISTPITVVSGLATAARNGVLVKGGVYLEQGRKLTWLGLDKTGTITRGRPELVNSIILDDADKQLCQQLVCTLAQASDHPVSQAIARSLSCSDTLVLEDFQALPGRGISASIKGQYYMLGNHRLIHAAGICSDALEARLTELEKQGQTVVLLADSQRVLAIYAVADTLKPESRSAIEQLHAHGVKSMILSGDNQFTVDAIAKQVGIDQARGNLLPEDKLQVIDELSTGGYPVAMAGDGINDAPALARADIGFAMGAIGTDAAIETADVAIMDDDLRKIPWFIGLSQRTHRVLVQNIALALGIKAIFLVLTIVGLGTMWMAVFADVGASLIVVANGLRLLKA